MKKILLLLKNAKLAFLNIIRPWSISYRFLRIPRKRISSSQTGAYFEKYQSKYAYYKTKLVVNIDLHPPLILNTSQYQLPKKYTFTNFIICLPYVRYSHLNPSVITSEGYQLAILSNHAEVSQNQHALFHRMFFPKPKFFNGTGLLLSTPDDNNYFHCLFQIAPKLWNVQRSGHDINSFEHYFLELSPKNFQSEILKKINLDTAKIRNLNKYKYIEVEKMYFSPPYWRPEPWICEELKRTFLTCEDKKEVPPKKLYLSRSRANHRKLDNEAELLHVIESYGFEVLHLEGMSIRDQARLFYQAEIVMSPHGAALSNIVFCKSNTKIIELRGKSHLNDLGDVFEQISGMCSLRHYTYFCDEIVQDGARAKFWNLKVSLNEFSKCLNQVVYSK